MISRFNYRAATSRSYRKSRGLTSRTYGSKRRRAIYKRRNFNNKGYSGLTSGYNVLKRTLSSGGPSNPVFWMDESAGFQITSSGQVPSGTGFGFNLQFQFALSKMFYSLNGVSTGSISLPGYADIANLYDNYKIKYVQMKIWYSNNSSNNSNVSSSIQTYLPTIIVAKDYDDSNNASWSDLLQYQKVRMTQLGNGKPMVIRVKPKPQNSMYNSVSTTSYGPTNSSQWIATSYPDTPHYGLKLAWNGAGGATTAATWIGSLQFIVTYYIEVKNPK